MLDLGAVGIPAIKKLCDRRLAFLDKRKNRLRLGYMICCKGEEYGDVKHLVTRLEIIQALINNAILRNEEKKVLLLFAGFSKTVHRLEKMIEK